MKVASAIVCAIALTFSAASASAQTAGVTPDPSGDWRGVLSAGAARLRIALHLGTSSTFDSPDQGALALPAQLTVANDTITVVLGGAGRFTGRISADGSSLDGTYTQGAGSIPLHFERGSFAAANRPQTPKPPFPYRSEDVVYDNPAEAGAHLAGTLTLPAGNGPFPAVLLITGSGTQDRDETVFEHKPFAVLADALTRHGVAVLRADDRGAGGSSAATPAATGASDATDVAAGLAWLRARKDIDPARTGLLGHSEGAATAALVASRDPAVAFVVMWAGTGVAGEQVIVDQVRAQVIASGGDVDRAKAAADAERAILRALLASNDPASARAGMNAALARMGQPPVSEATLAQMNSPRYRYFLGFDPAPSLRAIGVPVLALLGGRDTQVTATLNEAPLRAALAGNPHASVEVLAGLNHLFQVAQTGAVAEYGRIEQTIDLAALDRMVEWIVQVTHAGPGAPRN